MIEHVMPLCLTISWVYTVAMLTQSIVYEKEQRLKEVSFTSNLVFCKSPGIVNMFVTYIHILEHGYSQLNPNILSRNDFSRFR